MHSHKQSCSEEIAWHYYVYITLPFDSDSCQLTVYIFFRHAVEVVRGEFSSVGLLG